MDSLRLEPWGGYKIRKKNWGEKRQRRRVEAK